MNEFEHRVSTKDGEWMGYLPLRPAPSFNPDWSVLTIFVQRQLQKCGWALHNHLRSK